MEDDSRIQLELPNYFYEYQQWILKKENIEEETVTIIDLY